jgi:adenine-specific DNA-methyltransferase
VTNLQNEEKMIDENNIEKIDLDKIDWRSSREFFESLGETLDKLDDKDEAYDFTWVGKRKAVIEAGAPINKTLRPDVDNSKNWNTTQNLFIEGDNLDALKLLQESYLGKVKMIYIDPPYNTGKDFVYHDNFKATVESYDEDTEYKDESGNIQFKKNERSNGRYHSDWLSMMYPRLKLARNMLTEDGVIFISIDDNEQVNLKKLCSEVFGDDNVEQMIWKKNDFTDGVLKLTKRFRIEHEYIVCCYRDKSRTEFNKVMQLSQVKNEYGNVDNDPRGPWISVELGSSEANSRKSHPRYYKISAPGGSEWFREWLFAEDEMKNLIEDNRVYFGKNGDAGPRLKKFVNEKRPKAATSILADYGSARSGARRIEELFEKRVFDNPKPTELLVYLQSLLRDSDYYALDFFSGSATLADAVMQLNAEDGGNRKWIMVQLPEETDKKSEPFIAGYETISEISRERIRRAGGKIAADNPDSEVDYGFRSLVIADTNYKEVYKPAGEQQQSILLDSVDNIKDDRSELDLLYGVLTQSALELNRPCETRDLSGSKVFLYDYFGEVSGLVACFSSSVPEETIKEIAKLKPLTAVFKDSSFTSSQDKVNLAEHFRILSPDTKVKVI